MGAGAMDGVPLLLAAAEVIARKAKEQRLETQKLMDEPQGGRTVLVNSLRIITVQIEVAAVGIFSLFEARMQHHMPDRSFFRELRKQLIEADQPYLADRLYQYYLAVNILKHGRGKSYEELLAAPNLPFAIKRPEDEFFEEGDIAEPEALIDFRAVGFFDGLIETLRQAYLFLEGN